MSRSDYHPRIFVQIHNELSVCVDRLVEVGAAEVTDVLTSSLFRIRHREFKLTRNIALTLSIFKAIDHFQFLF